MVSHNEQFERYELVERIAVGGMAEVFRAKSYGPHGFEKTVAIKRILPELACSDEFERRFIAEAKLACSLDHTNIVHVFDFSRFGDSLYIVMEFVDGTDLARLLAGCNEHGEKVPLGAALHIAIELLKGLDFAHERGIIHRDVSPPNILLSRSGEVKVADFGIAKPAGVVTSRARKQIMGKWRYMSPEQTRGHELDLRSDLFAAAAVLYELFTGQRLFPGDDAETIVRNIHSMEIPPLSALRSEIPATLDDLMARALERDRGKRTARAADLWAGLIDVSYAHGLKATAMSVAGLVARHARRDVAEQGEPPPASAVRLIDDIINSELRRAQRSPSRSGGPREVKRHTVPDLRIPPLAAEDEFLDEENGQGVTASGEDELEGATTLVHHRAHGDSDEEVSTTWVRARARPDGMSEWTVERSETVEHQSYRRPRRWLKAAMALLLMAAFVIGLWQWLA